MSIGKLRSSFGPNCHWCGLAMNFDEPRDTPESATIEHLHDATFGSLRRQKHRRLAHAACNQARNEFRLQAERGFASWIAGRIAARTANDAGSLPAAEPEAPGADERSVRPVQPPSPAAGTTSPDHGATDV